MLTIIETPKFQNLADTLWTEAKRLEFISWIAVNPPAGDVIPGSGGARKVRGHGKGKGKCDGLRVIYFHLPVDKVVLLIALYAKSQQENISLKIIKEFAQMINSN